MNNYPNSRVTFLDTPVYSIVHWNTHFKHKEPSKFREQDSDLSSRIRNLNSRIKQLNRVANQKAPDFNQDIYKTSKIRTGNRLGPPTPVIKFKFSLYYDGIHPTYHLARVWLRKLEFQIFEDCWSH